MSSATNLTQCSNIITASAAKNKSSQIFLRNIRTWTKTVSPWWRQLSKMWHNEDSYRKKLNKSSDSWICEFESAILLCFLKHFDNLFHEQEFGQLRIDNDHFLTTTGTIATIGVSVARLFWGIATDWLGTKVISCLFFFLFFTKTPQKGGINYQILKVKWSTYQAFNCFHTKWISARRVFCVCFHLLFCLINCFRQRHSAEILLCYVNSCYLLLLLLLLRFF